MEQRTCRICNTEKDINEFNKGWLKGISPNCRDCDKERGKKYRQKTSERKKVKRIERDYGITYQEYLDMIETQNGECKICGSKDRLCIDHDHLSGNVRGLLCGRCNSAIGFFDDNIKILKNAIKYLEAK